MGKLYECRGIPTVNALSQEEYKARVLDVFQTMKLILEKSFGPYGASTIISNMANSTSTKDGYTIASNLLFNTEEGDPIDHILYKFILSVCERTNHLVGDGTTTVILAVVAFYEAYMEYSNSNAELDNYPPRDTISMMKKIQDELVTMLKERATPIGTKEERLTRIRQIIEISSNNDEEIINNLMKIYEELEEPMITCVHSENGESNLEFVDGYQADFSIIDELFINSDDRTCTLEDAEVIIFDHKVGRRAYEELIRPLTTMCTTLGRPLAIIAPQYDTTTLHQLMKKDIRSYYAEHKTCNLIPIVVRSVTEDAKKRIGDLAVLLNTEVVDMEIAQRLFAKISEMPANKVFDVSARHIPGINIARIQPNKGQTELVIQLDDGETNWDIPEVCDEGIRIGFCRKIVADFKKVTFKGFFYDKDMYDKAVNAAYSDMKNAGELYGGVAMFNTRYNRAKQRYNALQLKMALIEVGGDSTLSQNQKKDAYDDSICAVSSAIKSGYIVGGTITTRRCIREILEKTDPNDTLRLIILTLLDTGFEKVYDTIFTNSFGEPVATCPFNEVIELAKNTEAAFYQNFTDMLQKSVSQYFGVEELFSRDQLFDIASNLYDKSSIGDAIEKLERPKDQLFAVDLRILMGEYAVYSGEVFDVVKRKFTTDIINSADLDIQVLIAVVDLVSILINGNQMVITSKNNFGA